MGDEPWRKHWDPGEGISGDIASDSGDTAIPVAEVTALLAFCDELVVKSDHGVSEAIVEWERRLELLFESVTADLGSVVEFDTDKYFTVIRAGRMGEGRLVIRAYAYHRSIGTLDILCVYLAVRTLRAALKTIRLELRLQMLARRRLRTAAANTDTTAETDRAQGRMHLRRRLSAVSVRTRGAFKSLLYGVPLVLLFSALSACVGRIATMSLGSVWAGWLIGPVIGAVMTLTIVHPLAKRKLRVRLERASHVMLTNLLGLQVIRADAETRARYERCALREAARATTGRAAVG